MARVCGATPQEMKKCWPAIREFFEVSHDGQFRHAKLETQRIEQAEMQSAAAAGGRARAASALRGPSGRLLPRVSSPAGPAEPASRSSRLVQRDGSIGPGESLPTCQPACPAGASDITSSAASFAFCSTSEFPTDSSSENPPETPQNTHTERARERAGRAPSQAGRYAWSGRPPVPMSLHIDFRSRLGLAPEQADTALLDWYRTTSEEWRDSAIGDNDFDFWRSRFKQWVGSTTEETFTREERQRAEGVRRAWGRCNHNPPCGSYEMCVRAVMHAQRHGVSA